MTTRVITGDIGKSKGLLYWQEGTYDPSKPVHELGVVNPLSHSVATEKDTLKDSRFGDSVDAAVDYGNPTCTLAFTLFQQNALNRSLANGGTASALTAAATSGASLTHTFDGGKAGANFVIPGSGPVTVESVTLGGVALAADEYGYRKDARIVQVLEVPAGATGDDVVVTYKNDGVTAADGKSRLVIGNLVQRTGTLIFVGTSKMGPKVKIRYPNVTIPPASERSLIGDEWTSFEFSDVTVAWDDAIGGFALEEDL